MNTRLLAFSFLLTVTLSVSSVGQGLPRRAIFDNAKELVTDYLVLDGLFTDNDNPQLDNLTLIRIHKLKNDQELKELGIKDVSKSYTFYESEPSLFYQYIFRWARQNRILPISHWDVRLPLIINNKLLTPNLYSLLSDSDTTGIRAIEFVPITSAGLNGYPKVVYGAFKVEVKK